MLQKLNERIQGLVAWIIVILVTITFALFGVDYYLQSRHDTVAQVEVNGQPITKQAFEISYRRTRQLRDLSHMTDTRENQLKQQLLDEMIVNTVSMQSAHQAGFEVNPVQANAAIVNIPQFQESGRFSTDRYAQALNSAFFTPESFQQEVRQGMLLNQQRFALIGTAFALPSELNQFVKLYMQTRDYDYLRIPALRFINQVKVSDEDINQYYQQHKNIFLTPEMVSIEFVRLSMQSIKNHIEISSEQVKRFYDENKNNFFAPAQWQVAHILIGVPDNATPQDWNNSKLLAQKTYQAAKTLPEQFDQQATELTAKNASHIKTGVLPWIIAGQSPFDKALVQLTMPGQLSAPIKTKNGYELFKLLAYKPAAVKPFQDVQAEIKEQMLNEQAQTQYTQALEQLSDLSYQTPDSLKPVAKALHLTIEQTEPFSRHGGQIALTKNQQVIHAAFSHDVLKFGNNSEPIQLDNDSVLVLRVNKHLPATTKALVDVKLLIAEKLAHKKAEVEAKQFGLTLLNAQRERVQREKFLADSQLQWHDVNQAGRDIDAAIVPTAINELAFNLPRPDAMIGQSLIDGDYAIVRLKKINDGKLELLDKEQTASIKQQIETSEGLMDYDLYINNLMSHAKIVRH